MQERKPQHAVSAEEAPHGNGIQGEGCAEGSVLGYLETTIYLMVHSSHLRSEPQGLHGKLAIDSGPLSPESKNMNESFAGELCAL